MSGRSYLYDSAGNILSDGVRNYVYDQDNRLIRVSLKDAAVGEYAYDAFGRRTKKVASGITTLYHYDLSGNLIAETDGNGNPQRDYIYLNGEPLALKIYGTQAGMYWFINDHLGTPQKIVNNSGQMVWSAGYLPFGKAQVTTETVANNFRFPGQYFDSESGLHYNWHRYYDPETGRYITADPIGLEGGINLYAYVMGNPVNRTDPWGLMEDAILPPKSFTGSTVDIIYTRADKFVNPDKWDPNQRTENFMAAMDVVVIVLSYRVNKIGEACLPKTYEILSGVRRSKAAELLGKKTINAEIVDAGMKRIGRAEIPIEALRSPKAAIDVSTQKGMDRFMNTLNMTKNGSTPPDILVTPGTKGTRIIDIILDAIGGE